MSQCFFNASNSSAFVGHNSEPQTAPGISTAIHGKCDGVQLERDPTQTTPESCKALKQCPQPRRCCLGLGLQRSTATRLPGLYRAASEGKRPLPMDKESLDFGQVDGPKSCFLFI